jgi:molybdate transport system substrate-binding protein
MVRRILLLLSALICAVPALAAAPGAPLVLAAASLQEALADAADAWARQGHPRPVLAFAASSALARQIEAGAPADLFISADREWMDALAAHGQLRAGSRADLASNRLVLIAPAGTRLALHPAPGFPMVAALGSGRLALADPDAVPAGIYARQALTSLGIWPQVAGRLARAENVRAALALVARGAAPLGIVYATDARAEPRVQVLGILPASSHPPITYPVAVLARATSPDAEPFRRFLLSRAGQALLARRGFARP